MTMLHDRKSLSSPTTIDRATGWLIHDGDWVNAQDVRTTLRAIYAPDWQRMCAAAGVTPVKRAGLQGDWVTLADARRMTDARRMAQQRAPPPHPSSKMRQVP